jgi:hypothetical protein
MTEPNRGIKPTPSSSTAEALFPKRRPRELAVLFGGPNRSFYTNGVIDLAGAGLLTVRKQAHPV